MKQKVALRIKIVSNEINRKVTELLKEDDNPSSSTQMRLLNFIHRRNNKQVPVYQKDIEMEFDIRRSTATGVLQTLEKRRFIERKNCAEDNRLKAIFLTDLGNEKVQENLCKLQGFDRKLIEDLSTEELDNFLLVLDKISENCKNIEMKGGKPG
ncbi:MarR family winged helix-turn-helix transcriptional regulator [Enterococcus sp. LJL99]